MAAGPGGGRTCPVNDAKENQDHMALDTKNLAALAAEYAGRDPQDVVALALREYDGNVSISFSGAEDIVLVDMAKKIGGKFNVFSLDTGRLHPETYRNGLGDFVELLAAERELARARFTSISSKADLLTSSAALAFSAGAGPAATPAPPASGP